MRDLESTGLVAAAYRAAEEAMGDRVDERPAFVELAPDTYETLSAPVVPWSDPVRVAARVAGHAEIDAEIAARKAAGRWPW